MFSQQYTRQLSTSPPPFSYASIPSNDSTSYSTYSGSNPYCGMSANVDMALYPQYLPPIQQAYNGMVTPPVKQEFYGDDEINPFSMSYASISGVDVSTSQSYQDVAVYVSNTAHQTPAFARSYSFPH